MGSIIVSALVSGSLYALVAGGLSLVWGPGLFSFAHGVLIMVAAYVVWFVASPSGLGAGLPIGIVVAIAAMAVVGAALYLLLVRPWVGKRKRACRLS